jgi:3,4-dihydroxy 2-butanone 4-phosphate synthase/GTP cyclohydrolase II
MIETQTSTELELDTIEAALADIKNGKVVIVVDDEDRENEGDFICAADKVTPDIINFMASHGRGLICTPVEESLAKKLELNMMVSSNTALHETAFTVSIDYLKKGCTTGISAYDRAVGIQAMIDPHSTAEDFARPGHIFPLVAKQGGVLRRTGHTEAAVDLARLAGCYPAGVLVEILNADGSMARLPQLLEIAKAHDLKVISIKDLVAHRMKTERIVEVEMKTQIKTGLGTFDVTAYRQITTDDVHLAISMGDFDVQEPSLVRVHSSSETGDILGILFDGYGTKLEQAMATIATAGKGILLYIRHGEKGDSIINKLRLLDTNKDNDPTISEEQRDFGIGAQILRDFNVKQIRLLSNTKKRRIGITGYGLEIVETVAMG